MSEGPPVSSGPPPEVAAVADAAANLPPGPDDAGDLRGHHFSRLVRAPVTLILGGILVIGASIVAAATIGPGVGAAAAGGALLFVLVVVFLIARSAAESDFFKAYASGRSLNWTSGKTPLPPVTPLLQKGDKRYATQRLDGVLPGGMDGTLALYTYEDESTDSDGNSDTSYYHSTIATTQLPDGAIHARAVLQPAGRVSLPRLGRGRVPKAPAGRARERGRRQALRDLLRRRRRPQPGPPDPLPQLPRLARRPLAGEVRLRARRRRPGRQSRATRRAPPSSTSSAPPPPPSPAACTKRRRSEAGAPTYLPGQVTRPNPPTPDAKRRMSVELFSEAL